MHRLTDIKKAILAYNWLCCALHNNRLGAGKLSRHVTSHPGQLSLAIPQWVVVRVPA